MKAVQRIFSYLKEKCCGKIVVDIGEPYVRQNVDTGAVKEWTEYYPDAVENILMTGQNHEEKYALSLVMLMQIMPETKPPEDQFLES